MKLFLVCCQSFLPPTEKGPCKLSRCKASEDRRSLGLDAKDVVANLHEGEHVDLGGDGGLLSLREVVLRVGQRR